MEASDGAGLYYPGAILQHREWDDGIDDVNILTIVETQSMIVGVALCRAVLVGDDDGIGTGMEQGGSQDEGKESGQSGGVHG